jgi:hypothetical protein
MPFARERANSQALSAFSLRFKQGKIPGLKHLAGWGRNAGTAGLGVRRAGTPFGDVPACRAFDPAPACFQKAILFNLFAKYAKHILFRYGESFHSKWEQPEGTRNSEWVMELEINTSAAGLLSPISGDAREILSSQTGLLLPLPPTAGKWGMADAGFGIPGINPANPPGGTNSGSTSFRRTTAQPRNRLKRLQLVVVSTPSRSSFHPGATNLPDPADGLVLTAGPAGTVLAHWSTASRATRYRVFKQIDGVDAIPVNISTVSDSDATLTGQPSGKTLKIYIIAANDAGQAQPSDTVTIIVP